MWEMVCLVNLELVCQLLLILADCFFTKFVDMALYFTLWYATLFLLVLLLLVLQKLIVFEQIFYARRGPPQFKTYKQVIVFKSNLAYVKACISLFFQFFSFIPTILLSEIVVRVMVRDFSQISLSVVNLCLKCLCLLKWTNFRYFPLLVLC